LLKDYEALRNVVRWFEREGADAWYAHSAEELLPPGTKCSCGASKWRKEKDILDVWFESGSSHQTVLQKREGRPRADVYLEGPDQFRGWFQSSLLISVAVDGIRPYEQVVTHGWTLDEKGAPMSKSQGNAMYPIAICEKWGADLLRLWVVSQDFTQDVRMSDAMMTQLAEAYRKIRNTFRFALSNLFDFDPARNSVANADLWEMDAWMLRRTADLVRQCREWNAQFEFHRVYHAIHDFCVVDLSAFYFDVLKDRLYTFAPNSRGRRSAQTAVYRIASALVRLIAPTLVFTAEEVWRYLPHAASEPASIHMATFPVAEELEHILTDEKVGNWEQLLLERDAVLKKLEDARKAGTIAGALEAKLLICAAGDRADLFAEYEDELRYFFLVSNVRVKKQPLKNILGAPATPSRPRTTGLPTRLDIKFRGNTPPEYQEELDIQVLRADGAKCERCWNYSTHVGESADYPTICERCVAALAEIERDGGILAEKAKS
jgi:isoleucyl-tRNA synthetase